MPWREIALTITLAETIIIYCLVLREVWQSLRAKGEQR
jgi:hypothetical protein